MRIAILGLPQSGKRTLFTLLTGRAVTDFRKEGEAVEGVAPIRDPRVDAISAIVKPKKSTYAQNNILLCPDVEEGARQRHWLDAARKCDLLCMVVRAFASDDVYHPDGAVDPARDRANLMTELLLADLELVDTRLRRMAKEMRSEKTAAQETEKKVLDKCHAALENETPLNEAGLTAQDIEALMGLKLVTVHPRLWTYNVDEDKAAEPVQAEGHVFTVSCEIEKEIMSIDPAERAEFLGDLGLGASGVDRLNAAAYDALGLMSFYTMGPKEVHAWTIEKGTAAPQAAGKIHTDLERGFIRAEVIKFDDFIACGSEEAAKAQGKMALKGKDYILEDGDICLIRFSV